MKLWHEKRTWISPRAEQKLARLNQESIASIAVIKHAGYGDLLCTRPFLLTLRKAFPDAKITFSAISHYLRGVPEDLVDRLHVVSGGGDGKGWMARYREYKQLGHHTLLFDLTASTPSFAVTWANAADFKVGFQHRGIHRLIYDAAILRAEYRFEAETFLEQLHILGIPFDWPPPYAVPGDPLVRERAYCVYFASASMAEKSWPASHFVELIGQTARGHPEIDHVVMSGLAAWEVEVARYIVESLKHHPNVSYFQDPSSPVALLKGARGLVSNDTGMRHLGIAAEIPTVGIFVNSTPFGYWPRFGKHEVVYDRDGGIPTVNQVLRAVERMLSE